MPLFQPDLFVNSVVELSPEPLREHGLRTLLLDVDCTLKRYRCETVEPEVAQWMDVMRQHGIELCLISNGKGPRIKRFADSIQVPYVAQALKPLPWGCQKALRLLNVEKKSTAMVGDQVFADLLAGKFAGLFTVLVRPIHPEEEQWFTRMKRPFEKLVLKQCPWSSPINR